MRHVAAMLAFVLALGIFGPVAAGPFEDVLAAWERQDYALAVQWYRKAADQGEALAQYNLGLMYRNGQGVPQDYALAIQWYRKAAEQGYSRAQCNLGVMYFDGYGVPKDYALAVQWYRKAADQGEALAQYNLGVMYGKGYGVPKDYVLAYMWHNLGAAGAYDADTGDINQKAREALAAKMTRAQIAEAQRLASEWKPAK